MNIIGVENEDLGKVFWHLPETAETRLKSLPDNLQKSYITIATILLERYFTMLAGLYRTVPGSTDLLDNVTHKIIALEKETFESLQKL